MYLRLYEVENIFKVIVCTLIYKIKQISTQTIFTEQIKPELTNNINNNKKKMTSEFIRNVYFIKYNLMHISMNAPYIHFDSIFQNVQLKFICDIRFSYVLFDLGIFVRFYSDDKKIIQCEGKRI